MVPKTTTDNKYLKLITFDPRIFRNGMGGGPIIIPVDLSKRCPQIKGGAPWLTNTIPEAQDINFVHILGVFFRIEQMGTG